VALRPGRPILHFALGEEIRHGAKAHDKRREQDSRRLPPREKQHGRFNSLSSEPLADDSAALSSFTGSPLARTSLTIERICRTRTPSAISTSIWSSSTTLVTLPTSRRW
jgi:hypothetical protein